MSRSSPRLRGSAAERLREQAENDGLPAPAGVSRQPPGAVRVRTRSSCACGGQPGQDTGTGGIIRSSPRLRGSAAWQPAGQLGHPVLPAPARVSRSASHAASTRRRPPRACGGQPSSHSTGSGRFGSSPRLRGSAGHPVRVVVLPLVLPAPAGVSRRRRSRSAPRSGPPRACGVSRPWRPPRRPPGRPPRACGGQPVMYSRIDSGSQSSPRLRRSADRVHGDRLPGAVLPARAGVSRRGRRCTRRR